MTMHEYENMTEQDLNATQQDLNSTEHDLKSTAQEKLAQLKQMLAEQRSRLEQTVQGRGKSIKREMDTLFHDHPAEIIAGVGVGAFLLGKLLGSYTAKK